MSIEIATNSGVPTEEPAAWIIGDEEIDDFNRGYEAFVVKERDPECSETMVPLYSQEYVNLLIRKVEELQL
ncbi:hypothetical protein ACLEEJ_00355 [Lonsdalea quercina]|uniref:hypothetical protein n=1 Tax=Lonsdalea quercina TaxID=71657 RepID=UPI003975B251